MSETNPIIKQVQLDSSTHEIGAKYDEAENEILTTYGNSLSLSDGELSLIAKDGETNLSTVHLSQIRILYATDNNNNGYTLDDGSENAVALNQNGVIEFIEAAITRDDVVLISCEGILARLSYRNNNAGTYSYGFIGSDNNGRLYQLYAENFTESNTNATITKMPLFAAADFDNGVNGVLDITHGGTNNNTLTVNGVLVGNSETDQETNITTDFIDYVSDTSGTGGAFYAPADSAQTGKVAQRPLFGTLPVAYGGTGVQSFTANQLLIGNGTSTVATIGAASTNGDFVLKNTVTNGVAATPTWTKLVGSDIPTADIEIDSFRATTPLSVSKGGTGASNLSNVTVGAATKATQDESGNNIKNSYGAALSFSNNELSLLNKNGTALGSAVSLDIVTYEDNGLMSSTDKRKLDEFYLANAYATISYVDELVRTQTDITVYKGVVTYNAMHTRWETDNGAAWPPIDPENGWTYKVGSQCSNSDSTLPDRPSGVSEDCNVGDFLVYSTSSNPPHWSRIGNSNSEGTLYKKSPYTAGQMLFAEDNLGAVQSVPVNPTVILGNQSSTDGQTIQISVGGVGGTGSQIATLDKATTSLYGVTKLSNIATNEDKSSQTLAATPVGVYNAIEDALDGINTTPSYEDYTLLPESSQETTNSTTFKWSGNSITITSPNITADSYEFVVIPPLTSTPNATTAALKQREISALNQAMIVASEQARPSDAQAGYITLTALGDVPTITTHIRIIHKYNTDDMTRSATTAAAHEFAAQGYALQAQSSIHGVKKKSVVITTTTDNTNQRYPNKTIVSMAGVTAGDWVDGSGVYDQDWTIESGTDQVILHFSKALTNTAVTIYWASCQNFDDYLGGE